MFTIKRLHNNESGQTALETAIILIAFVVVASVFAFAILSAGTSSTDKSQKAINAGLEGVQSSMAVKGDVIGKGTAGGTAVTSVVFTVALVAGGDPVDMNSVVFSYRDAATIVTLDTAAVATAWIGATNNNNTMLDPGELVEVTLTLAAGPATNTQFTIEIKPPKGAVISLTRTTPAAIEAVMALH